MLSINATDGESFSKVSLMIKNAPCNIKNSKLKNSTQKMDDKKVKIETYAERLHNNMKELRKKNSKKPEIPM